MIVYKIYWGLQQGFWGMGESYFVHWLHEPKPLLRKCPFFYVSCRRWTPMAPKKLAKEVAKAEALQTADWLEAEGLVLKSTQEIT